jgi:hypothetical protein
MIFLSHSNTYTHSTGSGASDRFRTFACNGIHEPRKNVSFLFSFRFHAIFVALNEHKKKIAPLSASIILNVSSSPCFDAVNSEAVEEDERRE